VLGGEAHLARHEHPGAVRLLDPRPAVTVGKAVRDDVGVHVDQHSTGTLAYQWASAGGSRLGRCFDLPGPASVSRLWATSGHEGAGAPFLISLGAERTGVQASLRRFAAWTPSGWVLMPSAAAGGAVCCA